MLNVSIDTFSYKIHAPNQGSEACPKDGALLLFNPSTPSKYIHGITATGFEKPHTNLVLCYQCMCELDCFKLNVHFFLVTLMLVHTSSKKMCL